MLFQKKTLNNHFERPGVPASEDADYLCLKSGHNELAERLSEYILSKYGYHIDVVSIHYEKTYLS